MAQYRKKPVVIEAVRYEGHGNFGGHAPGWLWDALAAGTARATNGADPFVIHTLEGDHTCSPGDWLIRGVKGELYPCKPDIFAATYEQAEDCEPEAGDPRDPHPTRPVQVWVDADVGIAEAVERLNTIPGVRTLASCQGTLCEGGPNPYRPQVMATWPPEAEALLLAEFDVTTLGERWGYLHPRADACATQKD